MFRHLVCLAVAATFACAQEPPASSGSPVSARPSVIERVSAATVFIRTDRGTGTGFIVKSDGTIVTANHVLADAKKVACKTGSGEVFDNILLVARDERRDIAILKVAGFSLPTVEFADVNQVQPGQHIFVVGNPLGKEELKATVTDGVISGIRDFGWGYKVLQISAPISPGNSGGPVVNDEGKVLGVAAFKLVAGENLNFAAPIDYVRGLLSSVTEAKPLGTWDTPVAESPFRAGDVQGLTDYWKSSDGPLFYLKDTGKEVSIVNLSAPDYTYDFRWANGLIVGLIYGVGYYGNAKDFCALKKIDDSHIHRVCFRYRKEYDDSRAIAEAEKRFGKPKDIWVRVR